MRKGFTLLELIIVIVVIGVLATVAVPQYFSVAERARASEGAAAIGSVRSAQLRYFAEHGVTAAALGGLDVDIPVMKYFAAPTVASFTTEAAMNAGNVALISRSATQNPGFGAYSLRVTGGGTISCTGGTKCPKGF